MEPTREGFVLKAEYEELYLDWDFQYDGGNCSCHISPPCGSCTHEGNPYNLVEIDEAWEPELVAAVRAAVDQ